MRTYVIETYATPCGRGTFAHVSLAIDGKHKWGCYTRTAWTYPAAVRAVGFAEALAKRHAKRDGIKPSRIVFSRDPNLAQG